MMRGIFSLSRVEVNGPVDDKLLKVKREKRAGLSISERLRLDCEGSILNS